MKKQSLIHLHALLRTARTHVEDHHDVPHDAFSEYDALDIAPTHIHSQKDRHKDAVFALTTGLQRVIDQNEEVAQASSTASSGVVLQRHNDGE